MSPENASLPHRHRAFLLILAGCAALLAGLRWTEFPVGAATDDAYYVEMARSIAEGLGPVIKLNPLMPAYQPDLFPPGFPLLLSPLARALPWSLEILKVPSLLSLLFLIPLGARLLARQGGPVRWPLALLVLNPWVIAYSCRVLSDLPFTALSLAAILVYLGWTDAKHLAWRRGLLLVLLTAAAIEVRTVGLALPVAMGLDLVIRRRWQAAVLLTGGIVAALLLAVWVDPGSAGPVTGGYIDQVFQNGSTVARLSRAGSHLLGYIGELAALLVPVFGSPLQSLAQGAGMGALYDWVRAATGGLLAVLILTGLSSRRDGRFLLIYLVIHGGVLLNFSGYPSGIQLRLLLPLLPILLVGWSHGMQKLLDMRWPASADRTAAVTAGVLVVALSLGLFHNGYRIARPLRSTDGPGGRAIFNPATGSDWIRRHTDPDAMIMVRLPLKQHIHLGRPVVDYGMLTPEALDRRLERFAVAWVMVGPHPLVVPGPGDGDAATLRSLLEAPPAQRVPVHEDPAGPILIYRINAAGE